MTEQPEKYKILSQEKESWAQKRKALGKQISDMIVEVREAKKQRDASNTKIKDLKALRDEKNAVTNVLIGAVKELEVGLPKENVDFSKVNKASALHKQIRRMEQQMETEVMTMNQEKRFMKQLNALKREYEKLKEFAKQYGSLAAKNKEIRSAKKDAKKVHDEIQRLAMQSEDAHKKVLELSKQVDLFRVQEKEAHNSFVKTKEACTLLERKLKIDKTIEHSIAKKREVVEKKKEKSEQERHLKKLKDQTKEVEAKIKKKEKLTTEDLLILQAKE